MAEALNSIARRAFWRTQCRQLLSKHLKDKLGISVPPAEVRLIPKPEDPYRWKYLPEKSHLFKKSLSKHTLLAYREIHASANVSFEAVHSDQILNMASSPSGSMQPLDAHFVPTVDFDTSLDSTPMMTPSKSPDLEQPEILDLAQSSTPSITRYSSPGQHSIAELGQNWSTLSRSGAKRPREYEYVSLEERAKRSTAAATPSFSDRIDSLTARNRRLEMDVEQWKSMATEAQTERQQLRLELEVAQSTAKTLERENCELQERCVKTSARAEYYQQRAIATNTGLNEALAVMEKVRVNNFKVHPAPKLAAD